jgi:SPP1 gp7 family putative phage head morphogenesis protein
MAADMMLSLEEKVDLYRAIRGTYWTYQLSAYEEAAIKSFLPVVEEAGKRMHAKVEELSKRGKEGSWQAARAGQVEREMERLTAALNADITGSVTAASGTVGSAAVKEYNDILSVGGAIKTSAIALSPSQFASFFTESLPIMIPKVVTSMLDRAGLADMQNALLQEMRIGALTGASYDRMVKGLRQRFPELMRNELTTMTRTFFQTANARAFDRVYKENADILVGKTWISANDDRVCLMCLPLGGKTFYKGEAHPPMPRHPRCRCLFIPKTKSLKKIGVDLKKVEKKIDPVILRGRMKDGKWYIPQVGTGGAAPGKPFTVLPGGLRAGFTSLPEEVQLSMLGKGRHEMMKAGLLKVDDLIDYKTGRLYTLEELRIQGSSPPVPGAATIKTVPGAKTPTTPPLTVTPPKKPAGDPWDSLAYEDPDRFPSSIAAPWGDLRDPDARKYFLRRAESGGETIKGMLREEHVQSIYRVAASDDFKTTKARFGFWATDEKGFEFLDEGMKAEFRGTELAARGLGSASMEKAASYGKHLFKIEVPAGMHVAPADMERLLVLPGAKFDVTGITTLHGREVVVLKMTDDGSDFVKGVAKFWDDVEEAAGMARIMTKAGDAVEPLKPFVAPPPPKPGVVIKTKAGIELTELQKEAIDFAEAKAKNAENEILDLMSERYSVPREVLEKQYEELKLALLDEDKFELAFNTNGSPAMWKSLAKEGKFKNQFELGRKATSNGSLCPYKDSLRDAWEKQMYGGTFQKSADYRRMNNQEYFTPELGRERPFYGYVHDGLKAEDGMAFLPGTGQYGQLSFVLDKKRLIDRTTFTVGNSSGYYYRPGTRRPISTARNPISLLDAVYENAQYEASSVAEKIKIVTRYIKNGKGIAGLETYTEAQFIGGLTLDDVKVVMIPKQWKADVHRAKELKELTDMLDKKKVPYAFHAFERGEGTSEYLDEARKAAKKAIQDAAAKKAAEALAKKKAADI